MEVETREREDGVEILVRTENRVALVVDTGDGERIYLPEPGSSDNTYYAESTSSLVKHSEGYRVLHRGRIEDLTVLN
ncbi:MAG: hypothetical protein ABEJ75_00685 [Candidatus Nanohaloarchaea archaeon]